MPTPRRFVTALVVAGLIALGALAGATRSARPPATPAATASAPATAPAAAGADRPVPGAPVVGDDGHEGFDDD